jgi:GMP reductase
MKDFLLSYDSVCLRPKYSELTSRNDADVTVNFLGHKFSLPVVPANMKDVISYENAKFLSETNHFYIMHRFNDANVFSKSFSDYCLVNDVKLKSISVGVNDDSKSHLSSIRDYSMTPQFITIDVAHGHHSKVRDMVKFIQDIFKPLNYDKDEMMLCKPRYPKIIAGNVATVDGYKFLCDLGVDAVKVGIGGGSICTTRYKTGFHLPTLQSVYECAALGLDIPIIADGGAKHYGDIAKALTLGATMVMSGGWFASCIDSPAKIIDGKKMYRGSTSYEAKGEHKHIEGRTLELEEGFIYEERLLEIKQALQSSISYAGGKDLSAFNSVKWERI